MSLEFDYKALAVKSQVALQCARNCASHFIFNSVSIIDTELNIKNLQRICGMDKFDLTPEEEEMRICFLEIVKKYRSTENDPELTSEPNAFDLES